jgi:hypothetical protein
VNQVKVGTGSNELKRLNEVFTVLTLVNTIHQQRNELNVEFFERVVHLFTVSFILLLEPEVVVRFVTQVTGVDVHHTATRNSGRGSVLQIEDLEQHGAPLLETNTITVSKGQNSVIIHDGIHVFYPNGIDITIKQEPAPVLLHALINGGVSLLENFGQKTICPGTTFGIKDTVKFVIGDHLRVDSVDSAGSLSFIG